MRHFDIFVKNLLGICRSVSYCHATPPSHENKAGTLKLLRAAGSELNTVDICNSDGYFYPIQICLDVKKAGHVDPLSLDTGSANYHCFRYATTSPDNTRDIMDVIKPYRRSALRLRRYFLSLPSPTKPLQPATLWVRGPPTD